MTALCKFAAASPAPRSKQLSAFMVIAAGAIVVAYSAAAGAQPDTYGAPASFAGKTMIIPAGTCFEGRIDTSIGSAISHSGTRFLIIMSSPVLANGSEVLIPAGSQIMGEVVEAIPANKVRRHKGMPKPRGKLRVQITALRTPDGISCPMVASLAGETSGMGYVKTANPNLGKGIGYIGSPAGFAAVSPGVPAQYGRNTSGPQVITREQLARDPIYGADQSRAMPGNQMQIRSLVQRGRELFIDQGSPLSVKLDAPLKMTFVPVPAVPARIPPDALYDAPPAPQTIPRSSDGPTTEGSTRLQPELQTPGSSSPHNPSPADSPF